MKLDEGLQLVCISDVFECKGSWCRGVTDYFVAFKHLNILNLSFDASVHKLLNTCVSRYF